MCGIAGIWNRGGAPVDPAALQRMADALRHRGPDGEGFHIAGELGLAHRRLKIIDLSELGKQPMSTDDGRHWISFNGEIHNFVELRSELEARDVVFRSHTDTEVVLHAYRTWGLDCFEKFNGMWALAIWDSERRELLLSRDRFGIKPLVYSERGGRFAFASEPKGILAAFPEERIADAAELHAFLCGTFPVTGEATHFENIRHLRPGFSMVVKKDSSRFVRHWNFEPGREEPCADAAEKLLSLLTDAVRLRMRSDVPVSSALSGGIDSSATTLLAAQFSNRPISCFSLKYDEKDYDESHYSEAAAAGSPKFLINWVRPSPDGIMDKIERIVRAHDAPTAARGRYAWWTIMEQVGQSSRVLLTGDGGDELLAGYSRFLLPYMLDRVLLGASQSSRSLRGEFSDIAGHFAGRKPAWRHMLVAPVSHLLKLPVWKRYRVVADEWACAAGAVDRRRYGDSWALRGMPRPYRSRLNNALWHEFTSAGLPEMLQANDVLSMAHSVEARAPLLDHRIVEFCFSLPYHEKIRDGWTKSLLRRALHDVLPPVVRDRRQKLGTPTPLRLWMTRPDIFFAIRETLLNGCVVKAGIFDPAQLSAKIQAASTLNSEAAVEPLWRWLTTELWYRRYIAGTSKE